MLHSGPSNFNPNLYSVWPSISLQAIGGGSKTTALHFQHPLTTVTTVTVTTVSLSWSVTQQDLS